MKVLKNSSDEYAGCRRDAQQAVLNQSTDAEQATIKRLCEKIVVNVQAHNPAAGRSGLGEVLNLELLASIGLLADRITANAEQEVLI